MIKSYFIIACRTIWRNKTLSLINVLGLSIGLSVCMLIFLFTKDELSFDRFHEKADELYQVTCKIISKDGSSSTYGISGIPQGPEFKAAIPGVKSYVRVSNGDIVVKKGGEVFEEPVLWVDSNFFSVFSFRLKAGNPLTVLTSPNSIVITDEQARKYFGTEQALGRILEIENENKMEAFVVTGIAERSPENSSIKFKLLLPFSNRVRNEPATWHMLSYPTFLVIPGHTNLSALAGQMNAIYHSKPKPKWENDMQETFVWGAQPFLSMHLNSAVEESPESSDPVYSYVLMAIAVFILLIACINFVNLTLAQSLHRSKEIGIRKVAGGARKQLIAQFLGESFLVCLIAFSLAVAITWLALPVFNVMANKRLSLSYLADAPLIAGFAVLFLITVFASGFYPALVLSGLDPAQTIYHKLKFSGKNYLSKGLIVLQFTLATFLVTGTLFIYQQFNYFTKKDLGYTANNLLVISTGSDRNKNLMQVFKNEFLKIPGVQLVAPRMKGNWTTVSRANGKDIDVKYEHVDESYFATLQVPLLAGRGFSANFPADSTNSVIVNEAYAKAAGWGSLAIGKTIDFLNGNKSKLRVVGLIRDYHFESLKEKIKPQLFSVDPNLPLGKFMLRVDPRRIAGILKATESVCRRLQPYHPFTYTFMNDENLKEYEAEERWKTIVTFAAVFAVFISCIGLFGLTMLAVQKRVKEIGIRKVLGASVLQISTTISENFIVLVLLAFLLAVPAAWYAIHTWLQNFAYHIDLTWYLFAAALGLIALVAFLTVSIHTVKAAMANPVKSLRTE